METVPNIPVRYATIRNARDRQHVEAYLPANYEVIHEFTHDGSGPQFVIQGKDAYGWTLDGYVLPRFASGLIWGEEIDLSHPIMREIPESKRTYFDSAYDEARA